MLQLLNWRLWAVLALAGTLAASYWKAYHLGAQSVQADFDAYVSQLAQAELQAEQDARAKEHSMQSANLKVSQNYESLKTATAVAVGALDADRLRLQDAITASDPGANPAARACADDAARLRSVVGQCATALQKLAGTADGTEDQLVGLQDYVRSVVPVR